MDPTTMTFIGLVVVIAVGSVFFFLSNRSGEDTGAIQEAAPVTIEGEGIQPFNSQTMDTATDAALGAAVPTVTGQDFEGNEVTLPVEGESTIIAFMAHWCPFCQAELPLLKDEWNDGALPDGVNAAIVATATDEGQQNYPPSTWLVGGSDPWTETILLDSQESETGQAFGLTSYPFFVVVGPEGQVLARTSGELGRDQLQALVDVAAGAADAGTVGEGEGQSDVTEEATEGGNE